MVLLLTNSEIDPTAAGITNAQGKLPAKGAEGEIQAQKNKAQGNSERILTIPNAITLARLLLVPLVFILIISEGNNVLAFSLFALTGLTDWVDGYVARKTDTVTEFGKAIDPLVDRLFIACGVIALFIVGKLPLWVLAFIIFRDFFLLSGLAIVRRITVVEIKIRMVGKLTTTVLLTGFAGLIVGVGTIPQGLGWTDSCAFPGFCSQPYLIWIWFVYVGLILSLITLFTYIWDGSQVLRAARVKVGEMSDAA